MAVIEQVGAREILDSRGNPTVEVEVTLLSWYRRYRGTMPTLRDVPPEIAAVTLSISRQPIVSATSSR